MAMSKYTPAERARLKFAVFERLYPIALARKLSPAQLEDVAERICNSGKIFLTAKDEIANESSEIDLLVSDMAADPNLKHLFSQPEESKTASDSFFSRFKMTKAEFDALPSARRLALANEEMFAAAEKKKKGGK